MIAGFDQASSGRILLDGRDVGGLPPFKRPVNTVFQSYALFPHMTVAQNVGFGLEMLGRPKAEIDAPGRRDAAAWCAWRSSPNRATSQISGGQQQRVALARALAPHPEVLLLDEPLSALDLKLRKAMQIELKRLQRDTGITFVFVTHDQEEALTMSDRIAVMSQGKVRQIGSPREIYDHPAERFVADFIGEANLLPGELVRVEGPRAWCGWLPASRSRRACRRVHRPSGARSRSSCGPSTRRSTADAGEPPACRPCWRTRSSSAATPSIICAWRAARRFVVRSQNRSADAARSSPATGCASSSAESSVQVLRD